MDEWLDECENNSWAKYSMTREWKPYNNFQLHHSCSLSQIQYYSE